MKIGPDTARSIADDFRLFDGKRTAFCESHARALGVSSQTIQRILGKLGCVSGRKKRNQQSSIPDYAIEFIHATKIMSKRKNGQVLLDTTEAVQIMKVNGVFADGKAISTYNTRARQMGLTTAAIKTEKAWRPIITDYPNEMWQADATPCVLYFLNDKGAMKAANDAAMLEVSRKPDDFKKRDKHLIRYVAVDHASGAFYFKYVYAKGETAKDVIDFYYEAMRDKGDERYPMQGVPFNLWTDPGSAYKNQYMTNLCAHLGIKLNAHEAGNPRAKGAVEAINNWITKKFEGRLSALQPRSLEELNQWALEFCIKYNAEKKFRNTGNSRSQLWRYITEDQLRLCPPEDEFKRCARTESMRRVVKANLQISFNGKQYRLHCDPRFIGREAFITLSIYNKDEIEVIMFKDTDQQDSYILKPIEFSKFGQPILEDAQRVGEPRAVKDSPIIKANKKAEKALEKYGVKFTGKNSHRRAKAPVAGTPGALDVMNFELEDLPDIQHLPKKGIALEVKNITTHELTKSPIIDAMEIIGGELGRDWLKVWENTYLHDNYAAGMTRDDIEKCVTLFNENEDGEIVKLKQA